MSNIEVHQGSSRRTDSQEATKGRLSTQSNSSSITPLIEFFDSLRDTSDAGKSDFFSPGYSNYRGVGSSMKSSEHEDSTKDGADMTAPKVRRIFTFLSEGSTLPQDVAGYFKPLERCRGNLSLEKQEELKLSQRTHKSRREMISEAVNRLWAKYNRKTASSKDTESTNGSVTGAETHKENADSGTSNVNADEAPRKSVSYFFHRSKWGLKDDTNGTKQESATSKDTKTITEKKLNNLLAFIKLDNESYDKIAQSKSNLYDNYIFSPNTHRPTLRDIPSIEDFEDACNNENSIKPWSTKTTVREILDENMAPSSHTQDDGSTDKEIEDHLKAKAAPGWIRKCFKSRSSHSLQQPVINDKPEDNATSEIEIKPKDREPAANHIPEGILVLKEALQEKCKNMCTKKEPNCSPISMQNHDMDGSDHSNNSVVSDLASQKQDSSSKESIAKIEEICSLSGDADQTALHLDQEKQLIDQTVDIAAHELHVNEQVQSFDELELQSRASELGETNEQADESSVLHMNKNVDSKHTLDYEKDTMCSAPSSASSMLEEFGLSLLFEEKN